MKTSAAILAVAMALASAAAAAPSGDIASARPVIEAVNADWIPAMKAHDARRVAAAYADDGIFVLPDGRILAGRAAIEAAMRARFKPGLTVVGGGLHQDGLTLAKPGLIYEWGHGGMTSRDAAGGIHASSGPYLTVWRKDGTGHWRIIRNMAF